MTTRRIFILVGVAVVAVCLLVLMFVGGIVGFALYTVGNSDAAVTAKEFLRNNQRLKDDIGEVKDFGSIVTGGVNFSGGTGRATINLKVIGERKTVNATVELVLVSSNTWRVSSASYVNDSGQTIDLLDPYDSKLLIPPLIA